MPVRRIAWIVLGAVLLLAPRVFAQEEFTEFASKEDLFSVNFPGTPVVTDVTWETEYGAKLTGRVYSVTRPGPRTYSLTVVNYNLVQQIQTERAKSCFQGDERCSGIQSFSTGPGYWMNDVRGAMIYAAAKYLKRDIRLSHYAWSFLGDQGVENNELQFVNNKDKSQTHVNLFMHHSILYIMEETTPAGAPPPGPFVQSMTLKESDGTRARHYGVYVNSITIDPVEAQTCSDAGLPSALGFLPCETLPAAVRFRQGPNFSISDAKGYQGRLGGQQPAAAPAATPAPAERRNQ